jgi:hypothetical protein
MGRLWRHDRCRQCGVSLATAKAGEKQIKDMTQREFIEELRRTDATTSEC